MPEPPVRLAPRFRPARPQSPPPPPVPSPSEPPPPSHPRAPESAPPPAPPAPERSGGGALDAALRRPLLVVVPVLLAVGVAAGIGSTRAPVYTAHSQMRVAGIDVTVPGALGGYATATVALAATYSRSIDEPAVIRAVARETGVPFAQAAEELSASPFPESPVLRVRAVSADRAQALALANAGATALARHADLGIAAPAERTARLKAYRATARRLTRRRAELRATQDAYRRTESGADAARLEAAETAFATAQVRAEGARDVYLSAVKSQTATPQLEAVAPARFATSDERSRLQLLLVAGLAGGVLVGLALALLADRRAQLRRTA